MIYDFKGHKVSNSLSVFNYYKTFTGNSLEKDVKRIQKIQDNPDTDEDIDMMLIVQYIYYAMRCAAEKKELDPSAVIDEVDISDLADGTMHECIVRLVEVKKNNNIKAKKRAFLSRK